MAGNEDIFQEIKVINVIRMILLRGSGEGDDIRREVIQYRGIVTGDLLAEDDPCPPGWRKK